MKKVILVTLIFFSGLKVQGQKLEVGINGGVAYNSSPVLPPAASTFIYYIRPLAHAVSPAASVNCGYDLKKWQIRLTAGYQTLKSKWEGEEDGHLGDKRIFESNLHASQLGLALSRIIYSKEIQAYAGLSAGYVAIDKFKFWGPSSGLQAGIKYPISNHFAVNAEVQGRLFWLRATDGSYINPLTFVFSSRSIGTTAGLLYHF